VKVKKMSTLLDELSQLISALNENEIEYAVCGGLALAIHGFARATLDIDILIQPESLEKAYKIGAKKGLIFAGWIFHLRKEPLKFGACLKLMRTAKCFRLIC